MSQNDLVFSHSASVLQPFAVVQFLHGGGVARGATLWAKTIGDLIVINCHLCGRCGGRDLCPGFRNVILYFVVVVVVVVVVVQHVPSPPHHPGYSY